MIIGFDAEIFCRQQHGGISLHFSRLIPELISFGHSVIIFCPACSHSQLCSNLYTESLLNLQHISLIYYRNLDELPLLCSCANIDIFHCTYYSWRPALPNVPTIRTFHDIAFLRYPFSSNLFQSLAKFVFQLVAYLSADGIVVVSTYSRSEYKRTFGRLRCFLGLSPVPMVTVRNSFGLNSFVDASSGFANQDFVSTEIHEFVILYVGLRGGYKNFHNGMIALLKAVAYFEGQNTQYSFQLRIVSKEPLCPLDRLRLARSNISVTQVFNIDSESLATLYCTSTLLLHTSKYEGFGITVLEAMRLGCPVLAVDIPAVREVAGDTIFYSPDGSAESLYESLVNALALLHGISSEHHLDAINRSSRFSWRRSACSLEKFYFSLLDSSAKVKAIG